jgi:Beta-propeller repeat
MAAPANSSSVSATPANFSMISRAKYSLSVKSILAGLSCAGALSLFTLAAPAQSLTALGNAPLYFEANRGQIAGSAPFFARGHDYQFLISPAEAQIMLHKTAAEPVTVRMQFVGANAQAQIRGDAALPGKINYLTGNDPAQWRTGVETFARVSIGELYPGINLVYYGNQQQLEYDFMIAPGANPDAIAIHFAGVDKISVGTRGELILSLVDGEIRQPDPVIYQTINGVRKGIEGGYRIVDTHTVAFTVGTYDRSQPLVIDPILSYSTYFGGTSGETAWAVTLDQNGFVYVAGNTFSQRFYTNGPPFSTTNAYQTNYHGGKYAGDAFVAKFGNLGTNLIYLTYLGGSDNDRATAIAVDNSGNAYVAGYTDSTNFPTTTNALYPAITGKLNTHLGFYPVDAFVSELNTNGSALIYSTYLGGSQEDGANGIAVDSSGNAYLTGFTYSTNFPTTTNALQRHLACTNSIYFNANAFVAIIAPNGTNLAYSTYLGGTNFDEGMGIAVDASNFVYVTGFTASTNFPNTNSFQKRLNNLTNRTAVCDAFVAKFNPFVTNLTLVYSTYLGGTNNDMANSIAVDGSGNAYVAGSTISTDFPNTVGTSVPGLYSFMATNARTAILATNVFLTKIVNNETQAFIAYSAVFGGKGVDVGYGVAVDPAGEAFVVGAASSTNFPVYNIPTSMRATNSGGSDAFIIGFNADATALSYSTYLGGKGDDYGYGIAVDPAGNAYVVGITSSTNFPTLNAPQTFRNGTNDAFLAKIILQQPRLTVAETNGNAILAWLAFEPEFTLQSNTNVASSNTWVTILPPYAVANGFETVTLPATNSDWFFRLRH